MVAEVGAALGGGHHGFEEGGAHGMILELAQAGGGGAGGRGDHGAQGGWVAALLQQGGRTDEQLADQRLAVRAAEAGEHTGVDEGFGDEEQVGGAAACQAGEGVQPQSAPERKRDSSANFSASLCALHLCSTAFRRSASACSM